MESIPQTSAGLQILWGKIITSVKDLLERCKAFPGATTSFQWWFSNQVGLLLWIAVFTQIFGLKTAKIKNQLSKQREIFRH